MALFAAMRKEKGVISVAALITPNGDDLPDGFIYAPATEDVAVGSTWTLLGGFVPPPDPPKEEAVDAQPVATAAEKLE